MSKFARAKTEETPRLGYQGFRARSVFSGGQVRVVLDKLQDRYGRCMGQFFTSRQAKTMPTPVIIYN